MSASLRKAIGGVLILVFLCCYAVLAVIIGDHVPNQWAIRLAYYGIVGVVWGAPLIPLISWMNRGR